MDKQGRRHASRRKALALLLACSSLTVPATSLAQSLSRSATDIRQNAPGGPASTGWSTDALAGSTPADIDDPIDLETETGAIDPRTVGDPPLLSDTSGNTTPVNDPPYAEDLDRSYNEPLDPGAEGIDVGEAPALPADATGVRLGTMLLRPSISQSINRETIRGSGSETTRDYLGTTIRGTLTSDWSRHELSVAGEGTYEQDIGGRGETEPNARIDANLRLDLADETIANITGGYTFEREDNDDPNAVGGASVQSGVHQFDGGLTVEREAGLIRGLAGLGVSREIYTDAELEDGSRLSLSERDRTTVDGRLRLGYELSPAIIPFVEVGGGRAVYDETRDSAGYERSSWTYAARTGVEFDLSEKLRGELAAGYERVDYDDARLDALDAITFDGRTTWSPQRGTDVELALRTTLQDSTAPGESGWVEYDLVATLTHQVRHNLVGRLTGGATLRNFPEADNETAWVAGTGLTWNINRYLDLTGDVEYERNNRIGGDTDTFRAGLGLTLRK